MDEALIVGWELEKAEEKLERSRLTRIEILYRQLEEECVIGCNRRWLQIAENVLRRNNIKREDFSEAICNVLKKGRGKYRNVYLKGPTNCAKTFLLNPLNTIFITHFVTRCLQRLLGWELMKQRFCFSMTFDGALLHEL